MMASPATDAPWSHFDVAEICAYRGDQTGFLDALTAGLEHVTADYQVGTFKRTIQDLESLGVQGLDFAAAVQLLDAKIASMR
jgi:hypothetical protein